MNELNKLRYQLAFETVSYLIDKKRTSFDKTFLARINDAKDFFSDIIKGLNSILNPSKGYYIVDDLYDIVRLVDEKFKTIYIEYSASKKEVEEMINKFKRIEGNLEKLSKSSETFYKQNPKDIEELFNICDKLREMYSEDYKFLECVSEPDSD